MRRALANALAPWLAGDAPVVLAVSGGPDSTALMHAAAACRAGALFVATVDHGLRPESADEARAVARAAAALGLPHATLPWEGVRPSTAIQAEARAARYRLLAAHARTVGARLVLTGHTRDDQAETVLMRLIAGSGPAGLAGMRRERPLEPGLALARPFLDIAKVDLVAWCEAQGVGFARDPSNADDRYGRVRLRRLLPLLAAEGFTTERFARIAERAARDDAALAAAADAAFRQAVSAPLSVGGRRSPVPEGEGVAPLPPPAVGGGGAAAIVPLRLDGQILAALPDAVALRVLDLALDRAGGTLPRRLERLERLVLGDLLPALRSGRAVRRTLRGLAIAADPARRVTIRPAPPRRGDGLAAGAPDLLGKGEGSAYIGLACADEPAAAGSRPTRPRD
ncbi:tRNA lysidine(34) synthetase TilS [Methylobacterium sp. E-025]|nr:tRNA lysidine(34) synthetase TilS [Methylobacterium sp. E-025]MCJ2114370.1 tRNA lysidine(34) synthetase TilS [Methylobacterium sp. E-025]